MIEISLAVLADDQRRATLVKLIDARAVRWTQPLGPNPRRRELEKNERRGS